MNTLSDIPTLGFGLGLRGAHLDHIFEHKPAVDWFEIISENYMNTDGKPKRTLERIRADYPVVMHGVSMSIGTVDPLNSEYVKKLKALIDWLEPAWVSDHLCWTGIAHRNTHDLLPVPYTQEALEHIVGRIQQVQDALGRPLVIENPSTYLEFKQSHIPEAEFIAQMARESGCGLLLDVNNVYVTCFNHRQDAKAYIDALPMNQVVQIHLAGHSHKGTHIIDTHDDHVTDDVWALYRYALKKAGRGINTMVEWDDHIPEFAVVEAELHKARAYAKDNSPIKLPQLAADMPRHAANDKAPLHSLQHTMQDAVVGASAAPAKDWIVAKPGFAPEAQLGVYMNAYRLRLIGVTDTDFPALRHLLGDEAMDALLDDFVTEVASQHFDAGMFPSLLPDYLKAHRTATPFAVELAQLENAISQLAHGPENVALAPEHLAGMSADGFMEARLHPRATLQLFAFDYPVNEYFTGVMEESNPAIPEPRMSFVAVYRHEDSMWRLDLEAEEYALLKSLFDGATIGDALATLSGDEDELAEKLQQWFGRWMRNGLLAAPDQEARQAA